MWAGVYAALNTYGWADHEIDRMECWSAAMKLGRSHPDDDHGRRPIFKGARMIEHPKDADPSTPEGAAAQTAEVTAERERMLDPSNGERPVHLMRPVKPSGG